MDKLTHANFWDDIYARFPEQCRAFCDWIDDYKKANAWDMLFNATRDCPAPKYHDLPIGMQIGIFVQFTFEIEKYHDFFDGSPAIDMEQFVAGMKDWFFYEHAAAMEDNRGDGAFEDDEGAMMGMSY